MTEAGFRESPRAKQPIRDLGLRIEGTRLQPLVESLLSELAQSRVLRITPKFYLSTEWGVPKDTVAIAIPFYLVDPDLAAYHHERVGHVEGVTDLEILKYLRHEMGHVLNYAYQLYLRPDWMRLFGRMSEPYLEHYRPKPFSRSFVRHLPGWYAQKHPDEDFAETFAVWLTPGLDWRREYASWPRALEKLVYVANVVEELRDQEPLSLNEDLDEPVNDLPYSVEQYYEALLEKADVPQDLDALLSSVFPKSQQCDTPRDAANLIRSLEVPLLDQVFLWTGHFPEHTRELVRQMAGHADSLNLRYAAVDEPQAIVGITTLVTALAVNHVSAGSYHP